MIKDTFELCIIRVPPSRRLLEAAGEHHPQVPRAHENPDGALQLHKKKKPRREFRARQPTQHFSGLSVEFRTAVGSLRGIPAEAMYLLICKFEVGV